MTDSPIAATPYEVLGVPPTADITELRRSYRRMLRETHPDTGGVAVHFHAVQAAWDVIGTVEGRAAYDRGMSAPQRSARPGAAAPTFAPSAAENRRGTRPAPREFGLAGLWQRERYLEMFAEWAPAAAADPYSAAVVRSAPAPLRRVLAKAMAEETSGAALSSLGIGYTIWHGVATGTGAPGEPDEQLDHVVLGASGLFAMSSCDWGAPVRTRKGELIGAGLAADEFPVNALTIRARWFGRRCRVPVTAALIVVPDGSSDDSVMTLGVSRGMPVLLVQLSRLPDVLRVGFGAPPFRGGAEVFELRTRIMAGVRFL
ncbi:DnaJ-like protein [Glaciihabitans tibetensis]|uniref:DnaJ-like protein n=1 Tax=Glaciihabitans tibetensis TaxID=1266600 RepID=A0A2T0V4J8_9MICO|nr:J domain-containing protein [Glaciihabitans tibetensis]PRY65047.1 DnaJ-like protein [Glaciihabitans tibetensis]